MPHVESLSLFKAEEPQDEANVLSTLGLTSIPPSQPQIVQPDISMTNTSTILPTDNCPTQNSALPPVELKEQVSVESINPPPSTIKPLNMLETARNTVDLRSNIVLSKMASDDKGDPSSVVSNPILFPREDEQDGDEEMPLIDVDSDSEDETTE